MRNRFEVSDYGSGVYRGRRQSPAYGNDVLFGVGQVGGAGKVTGQFDVSSNCGREYD